MGGAAVRASLGRISLGSEFKIVAVPPTSNTTKCVRSWLTTTLAVACLLTLCAVVRADADVEYRSDIRKEETTIPLDFVFRLPQPQTLPNGQLRLGPWLQVVPTVSPTSALLPAGTDESRVEVLQPAEAPFAMTEQQLASGEFITPGLGPAWEPRGTNRRPTRLTQLLPPRRRPGLLAMLVKRPWGQDYPGYGFERLGTGAFQMDNAEPYNHFGIRLEGANRYRTPDIAEYFWAKTPNGRGPTNPLLPGQAEESVNYFDAIMTMEAGGSRMSVVTQLPLRWLDPVINSNTAGLGDMSVATKLVMLSGDNWRLTQVFRTYMNTGAASHGLGTGHVSMEPGLLFAYRPNPTTAWHGELKYWFPLGADPEHSGQILRYGLGINRVMYESDRFAILPSLEFVAFSVQDGRKTERDAGTGLPIVTDLDGDTIVNLYPGFWFVAESPTRLDVGISSGYRLTGDQLYDQLFRVDLRFGY